jgi:hypothetical protein
VPRACSAAGLGAARRHPGTSLRAVARDDSTIHTVNGSRVWPAGLVAWAGLVELGLVGHFQTSGNLGF